ncbi:hypothetical protein, partial [Cnuella takakiae]|uniref:hypothetical protein n=1 Tax=Cnuella takakiae TaxID=1302690 RepID=UPI001C1F3B51
PLSNQGLFCYLDLPALKEMEDLNAALLFLRTVVEVLVSSNPHKAFKYSVAFCDLHAKLKKIKVAKKRHSL